MRSSFSVLVLLFVGVKVALAGPKQTQTYQTYQAPGSISTIYLGKQDSK